MTFFINLKFVNIFTHDPQTEYTEIFYFQTEIIIVLIIQMDRDKIHQL